MMDVDNFTDLTKVKKSISILIEYLILRYQIRNLTFPGIKTVTNLPYTPINSTNLCLITEDKDSPKTIVYYIADLGVRNFKNVLLWIETNHLTIYNISTVIIVYEHKTSECERHLTNLDFNVSIELFSISNLQKNIFKNEYAPSIYILTEDEISHFLKCYSIKDKKKFPLIYSTGPECKYLNIKKGELIKFTRKPLDNKGGIGKSYIRYVI